MRTNNGCFFNVMSQCLNNQKGMNDTYCAKGLRLVSHEYVQKLEEKNKEENWVYQRFLTEAQYGYMDQSAAEQQARYNYLNYMNTIQYTAEEIKADTGLHEKTIIAGDRNIDGRIFCETYNMKVHLIDFFEDGSIKDEFFIEHLLIDTQGCHTVMEEDIDYGDTNLIHMAVYRDYFVPIVHQNSLRHYVSLQDAPLKPGGCDRVSRTCPII